MAELKGELLKIADDLQRTFHAERRVLSFEEYLELVARDPVRHTRNASRYVRDMFEHYGVDAIERPWGRMTRWRLFDLPFADAADSRREGLIGHEAIQGELFRVLENFVREGRASKVILLHGPNGSAKSTVAACVQRALEHYSTLDEGALYRLHWVFPNQTKLKGAIGFVERQGAGRDESYAHLPDEHIDARLYMEVRDHPLWLLPIDQRRALLGKLFSAAGVGETPSDWIAKGTLSHKSRLVFEALLSSYDGDLMNVLRHVQIERWFVSRRYRSGAVTLGPELGVDAGERQVTADRSLGALPTSLQSLTLFEAHGEIVDAAGGVLEFSDLLKRPIDAFKYLQITAETGEVALRSQNIATNCVFLASGNELHLAAFREHPEFDGFRGRFELIRAPYLRSWPDEQRIYDAQIAARAGVRAGPHATEIAARFAVLTRMRKPTPERYAQPLRAIIETLTAVEKMELYAAGKSPIRLDAEGQKLLRAAIPALYAESDDYPIYEGSVGASPREMRAALFDAAQDARYGGLSPLGVLDQIELLCRRTSEYGWLAEDVLPGGYHDHAEFRVVLRAQLYDAFEDELRTASGLIDEDRYAELYSRYVTHVSYWVKREKVQNPLTGHYDEPDEGMMQEVEALLGVSAEREAHRNGLLGQVAAWAIDHPDAAVDHEQIFGAELRRMREAVFAEKRGALARRCQDMVALVRHEGVGLAEGERAAARSTLDAMARRFGYDDQSATDAAAALLTARFAELAR